MKAGRLYEQKTEKNAGKDPHRSGVADLAEFCPGEGSAEVCLLPRALLRDRV